MPCNVNLLPTVADLHGPTLMSASSDEGRSRASPVALAKSIDSGRRDVKPVDVGEKSTLTREQLAVKPTKEPSTTGQSARESLTKEKLAGTPALEQQYVEGSEVGDDGGEQSSAEESTDNDLEED
ncbi:unnamed protein product [Closterium sp. NIES-53]